MKVIPLKICEICKEEVQHLKAHLKYHGITDRDYYDKYLSSTSNVCKVETCNNINSFVDLYKGYRIYCSNSCARTGKPTVLTKEVRSRGDRTRFLNNCIRNNYTKALFYIMEFSDAIKVGVCACDEDHIYLKHRKSHLKPLEIILYEGIIEEVADLEFNIKLKFNSDKGTEYFSKSLKSEIEYLIAESNLNAVNEVFKVQEY